MPDDEGWGVVGHGLEVAVGSEIGGCAIGGESAEEGDGAGDYGGGYQAVVEGWVAVGGEGVDGDLLGWLGGGGGIVIVGEDCALAEFPVRVFGFGPGKGCGGVPVWSAVFGAFEISWVAGFFVDLAGALGGGGCWGG